MYCKLIFVRHGQSQGNFTRSFLGHTDLDMTELGYKQAELVSKYLKNTKIDKIYSSSLIRAYNTAVPTAKVKGLEIIKNDNLKEIFAGKWEGMYINDIKTVFKDSYDVWTNNIGFACPEDGESVLDVQNRIIKEVNKIISENEANTVVIFTHATVIRTFFAYILGKKQEEIKDLPWPLNASINQTVVKDGKFQDIIYSYGQHLE